MYVVVYKLFVGNKLRMRKKTADTPASSLSQSEKPINSVQVEESNEDEKEDDGKYWNTPRYIEESSDSEEEIEPVVFDGKADKRCYGLTRNDEDHRWLYVSQSFKGWMYKICEMYPYSEPHVYL